jgi:formylmethanofuran dehydrogenase subunit E-like metal-binding protein
LKAIKVFISVLLLVSVAETTYSDEIKQLLDISLKELGVERGSDNLCVITDATYVRFRNGTTEGIIDTIQEATGCSIGGGNLLLLSRSSDYPLKIVLFRKDTNQYLSISHDGNEAKRVKLEADPAHAFEPDNWDELRKGLGASEAFTVITLANAWAAGAPYDFFRCVAFHNHICPGIISGYLIARYIQKAFPVPEGGKHTFISSPEWCKDDAIQLLLGLSPGKKSFFVKGLTDPQVERLPDGRVAGILAIETGAVAKAVVLKYEGKDLVGEEITDPNHSRFRTVLAYLPHLDSPEEFVTVVKEYRITANQVRKLTLAGVNPYEELGYVKVTSN